MTQAPRPSYPLITLAVMMSSWTACDGSKPNMMMTTGKAGAGPAAGSSTSEGAAGEPPTMNPDAGSCADAERDDCGVCRGGNRDKDCANVCFGSAKRDDCGVCNGDNSSKDCNGVCSGEDVIDDCEVCGGGNRDKDCFDMCFGTGVRDADGQCCEPDRLDCAGFCDGSAVPDCAGVCNGNDKGISHYADADGDGLGSGLAAKSCSVPAGRVANQSDCNDAIAGCGRDCGACLSDGRIVRALEISSLQGDFGVGLADGDQFGAAVAALGDIDGDSVTDIAVGAPGSNARDGAVWILRMRSNGTVKAKQRLGATEVDPAFTRAVGASLAALGDVNGDGHPDLAVGAPGFNNGDGRFWILLLRFDPSAGAVSVVAALPHDHASESSCRRSYAEELGVAMAAIGDLDSDGVTELAVNQANSCTDGNYASRPGGLEIVFLDRQGRARRREHHGPETLDVNYDFEGPITGIGDLSGDGVPDLAMGSSPGWPSLRRHLWILPLTSLGKIGTPRRITDADLVNEFGDRPGLQVGDALTGVGDLDGDGFIDLLSDEANDVAMLMLGLGRDGSPRRQQTYPIALPASPVNPEFSASLGSVGDLDHDGLIELTVGAPWAAIGGTDRGAIWLLQTSAACGDGLLRDCNGDTVDGCETTVDSDVDCGACGRSCVGRPNSGGGSCNAGDCQLACQSGWLDCNEDPMDGCELNGAATLANVQQVECESGSPALRCSSGYGNCNGDTSDGCETAIAANPDHCGACGTECPVVNGHLATCSGGQCGSDTSKCEPPAVDCDNNVSNGCEGCGSEGSLNWPGCAGCPAGHRCEYVLMTPPDSSDPSAVPGCSSKDVCDLGKGDCDGNPSNGCEANLTTELQCNDCKHRCGLWEWTAFCQLSDDGTQYECK